MVEHGSRRRTGIDPECLLELNEGRVASRTLAEALSVDQALLLENIFPFVNDELRSSFTQAQSLGILARMRHVGAALADSLDEEETARLAAHPSDTARGWSCFIVAAIDNIEPAELLTRIRPFADDPHFAVREWAWMAARSTLVTDLETSIGLLAEWADDDSERIRRFASEALRPRGVWSTHITALKVDPGLGLPILTPLRADPSRYVQDSVANWINDAAKTNPDWARAHCRRWLTEYEPNAATERIARRALRSLH